MTPDFKIDHPALKGFPEYYQKEILSFLKVNEKSRKKGLENFAFSVVGLAMITFAGLYIYNSRFSGGDGNIFVIFLFGLSCAGLFHLFTNSVRMATKEKIVGSICAYVGWTFKSKVDVKPDLSIWSENGLLPKTAAFGNRRFSFEDQISGKVDDAVFQSTEIHVEKKGDKKWHTEMRGQMMSLSFPRKFQGKTVVLRDQKFFQSKKIGDMKRVGLVDPVFEAIFEAYGTDQVEARYLLTPTFMQRLVDLESSVSGKNIRFGFLEGRLLIVVETANQFEAGSMFESLMSLNRTQKILDEIAAIFNLVDGVLDPRLG